MLSAPYEPVSARDPFVFRDDDGVYHMLVTTSIIKEGAPEGCLAHLVSADLDNWKQLEPFVVEGVQDQPECCDYFFQNGWYYLIFSLYGTARYRMSKEPFGPWAKPEQDMIDSLRYRVPKTAAFGDNRRLAVGFLSSRADGYGGCAIFREIIQKKDGTLSTEFVKEVMPAGKPANCRIIEEDTGEKCIVRLEDVPERFELNLEVLYNTAKYLCLKLDFQNGGTTRPVYLRMNIQSCAVEMGEDDERGPFAALLNTVTFGAGIGIKLIVFGDVAEMSLDCGSTAVVQLPEGLGVCSRIELYAESADLQFKDISILKL